MIISPTAEETTKFLEHNTQLFKDLYGKPVRQFGQWVVTADGLVCPLVSYFLPRILAYREPFPGLSWATHMSDKRWCNLAEFEQALEFLRSQSSLVEIQAERVVRARVTELRREKLASSDPWD